MAKVENLKHGMTFKKQDLDPPSIRTVSTSTIGIVAYHDKDIDPKIKVNEGIYLIRNEKEADLYFGNLTFTPPEAPATDTTPAMAAVASITKPTKSMLRLSIDAVLKQTNGKIVCVPCNTDPTAEDIKKLLSAQAIVGEEPKLICAPMEANTNALFSELSTTAIKLGAIAFSDHYNDSVVNAKIFGEKNTHECLYISYGGLDFGYGVIPASAALCGHVAKLDSSSGFWVSPSNKTINGVLKIGSPVAWNINNTSHEANDLNSSCIGCFINVDGVRLWGNRLSDKQFLNVERIKNTIKESLLKSILWAVDMNIGKAFFEVVTSTVNNFLRDMTGDGKALLGGICSASKEENPPHELAEGKAKFYFKMTPSPVAEEIEFKMLITNEYLKDVFK